MTKRQTRIGIIVAALVFGMGVGFVSLLPLIKTAGKRNSTGHGPDFYPVAAQEILERKLSKVGERPAPDISTEQRKLQLFIVPVIDFEETTVEEAVDYLHQRSLESDSKAEDRHLRRGGSFVRRTLTQEADTPSQGTPILLLVPNQDGRAQRIT